MNFEINVIHIPDAITAAEAKEMVRAHEETEMKKDVDAILECIKTIPWECIKVAAGRGETKCHINIGYDENNACNIREKYGWAWIKNEGRQLITNLFSAAGYKVTFSLGHNSKYIRIEFDWAD